MDRSEFFQALWDDFSRIAPRAVAIRDLLQAQGESVVNDHVAFRTFDRSPISLAQLEPLIFELGYTAFDEYRFHDKHLRARAYRCEGWPRIFLSELLVSELSAEAQLKVEACVAQIDASHVNSPALFWRGRLWDAMPFSDYEQLASESEYAAWLCAVGLRPNHFTVSVNALRRFARLPALLDFVAAAGYAINTAGGRIKGSAEVFLEQGATLAERIPLRFADGEHLIPSCYYEFALRHPLPNGRLYDGFVASSADKIFESTHRAVEPRG